MSARLKTLRESGLGYDLINDKVEASLFRNKEGYPPSMGFNALTGGTPFGFNGQSNDGWKVNINPIYKGYNNKHQLNILTPKGEYSSVVIEDVNQDGWLDGSDTIKMSRNTNMMEINRAFAAVSALTVYSNALYKPLWKKIQTSEM